ncbi:MAG: hypothetical protein QN131_07230 [Armatimonadota bacterium]|nr:hypothetical protein [Armatimonadota bacterium]
METVHAAPVLLFGLMVGYALLAVIAGACAVGRRSLPPWFWTLSLVALLLVALQVLVGAGLFLGGARPRRGLHLLYGVLVLAAGLVQYGLRPGGFFRRTFARELTWDEARAMALIALTQAALIARAWTTGGR